MYPAKPKSQIAQEINTNAIPSAISRQLSRIH